MTISHNKDIHAIILNISWHFFDSEIFDFIFKVKAMKLVQTENE